MGEFKTNNALNKPLALLEGSLLKLDNVEMKSTIVPEKSDRSSAQMYDCVTKCNVPHRATGIELQLKRCFACLDQPGAQQHQIRVQKRVAELFHFTLMET